MPTQSWSGKSPVFLMESALTSQCSSKSNKKAIGRQRNLGLVPVMPQDLFVNLYQKSKRQIRAKKFDNCVTTNIVTSSVRNNSKCIAIPPSRTNQYKHSFFVRTAVDWNHLDENTVSGEKLENFKSALT